MDNKLIQRIASANVKPEYTTASSTTGDWAAWVAVTGNGTNKVHGLEVQMLNHEGTLSTFVIPMFRKA